MITEKLFFSRFLWQALSGKQIPSWKKCSSLAIQTVPEKKNGVKQIQIKNSQEKCHNCISFTGCNDADRSNGVKTQQPFFYFYTWVNFTYFLKYLIFLKSPWWQVWTFCTQTLITLKQITKKNRKETHKRTFCDLSNIFKNISWPISICLKYFMTLAKTHQSPSTCLMYGP